MGTAIRDEEKELRRRIELYLRRTKLAPSRFGLEALGDPGFVFGVRAGRKVRDRTAERVHAWLDEKDPKRARKPR